MFTKVLAKVISLFFLGSLIMGISACGGVTPFPEDTATKTATIPIATRTPRPIPTPTPTLFLFPMAKTSNITENCIAIETDTKIPYRNDFGSLIINSWFYPKWTDSDFVEPYLFIAHEQQIILPTKLHMTYFADFAVSPDKTQVAIFNYPDLFIFDNKGKELDHLDMPASLKGASIVYWLKDGVLFEHHEYSLFDVFNGNQLSLPTDFPNRIPHGFGIGKNQGSNKIYFDPTLSRAIYLAKNIYTNTLYFSLWDLNANTEIAQFNVVSYPERVIWSSNGEFAVVNVWLGNQYGLVKIDRDGKTETILPGKIYDYSISPDSKLLAYWDASGYPIDFYALHIMNMETGNIQNLCLHTDIPVGMVWSPDRKNLAASFEYEGDVITTIIDFEQKIAYKIDDVAIPVGWLK